MSAPGPGSKSTVDEIRRRFDNDVERFSNLETGQAATVDSPLALELIAEAASAATPQAASLLDIGCGAGNYTLKLLGKLPHLEVTLIDLSRLMLDRATQRIGAVSKHPITALQGDVRDLTLGEKCFDLVVTAAVLHHLRDESEWRAVFEKVYRALRSGGSFWIFDMVEHSLSAVQAGMWERYGHYLAGLKGDDYRRQVFGYIEREDTPRPLMFQLDLLRAVGFAEAEILHKNTCFAAFGALKR
jgi:tRNA (cmo5U34)-methyltransferase